jgi:hypothetical protein
VWDPERYGTLSIPDDGLSFDIFTQVARVLRRDARSHGPDPMGGLVVRKLVGAGGSQSGTRITAYTNGVQPREGVFDALIPVVCAGHAADFNAAPAHPDPTLTGQRAHSRSLKTRIRDDLAVPVLTLNSETETAHYFPMRQPDTDRFRSWEIAGSSHGPAGQVFSIRKITDRDEISLGQPKRGEGNSTVEWVPTLQAAIIHVHHWISEGKLPPQFPPITVSGGEVQRDSHGNALGGIRLPEVEVPIAAHSGIGNGLGGTTTPFDHAKIRALYPTHDDYVGKVRDAAAKAEAQGVILPEHTKAYVQRAVEFTAPWVQDGAEK